MFLIANANQINNKLIITINFGCNNQNIRPMGVNQTERDNVINFRVCYALFKMTKFVGFGLFP